MKKLIASALLVVAISFLFTACEKRGDPPAIPPSESMEIDFSDFLSGSKSENSYSEESGKNATDNTNRTVAATVAGVWNTILVLNLAVPVAAFKLAIEEKPDYLDDRKWQWKYDVAVLSATYTARLTGQIRASDVKWEMYISREGVGGFGEFLWFEGTTALDGNSGQWILNQSQQEQVPMLQIDWQKEGTEIGSVKYTYIKEGQAFRDSYIEYGLTTNPYNAYYTVRFWEANRAKFVDVLIEWNTAEHNGRIKAADYFQDNLWHCWDGNGNDASCPAG